MARLAVWLPILLKRLDVGLTGSQFINSLDEVMALQQAQEFCLDLWPFIRELPQNIAFVKGRLPESMKAASRLLAELADEESVYQSLFVKQCLLAGLSLTDLEEPQISPAANELRALMKQICQSSDYVQGLLAIVTAELAATAFARRISPFYEEYFQKHSSHYSQEQVAEGMEWLRLHAKPQTGNALLLNRALAALDHADESHIPTTAQIVLSAILSLWRCPPTDALDTGLGARNRTSDLVIA
jgi:pyrroloquinoline quinone (PQQ) biosynthesis protein C